MKATIAILVASASAAAITSDVISSRKLLNRSKKLGNQQSSTTVNTFRKLEGKAEKQSDAKSAKEVDRKKKKKEKRDRKKVKGVVQEIRFSNGDEKTNSIQLPITITPSTSKPSSKPTSTPSMTPTTKPTTSPTIAAVEPTPSPPLPEPTIAPTYYPTVSNIPTTPLSACPAAYDTSKSDYVGGDKIEVVQDAPGYIFECDADKVMYCNIAVYDDSLLEQDEDAKEKWISAWVNVGLCITAADNGDEVVAAPSMAPSVTTITDTYTLPNADTTSSTTSPTPDTLPTCPPAYDMTKTTYVEGEMVTLNDYIFECVTLHVTYCNIAEWDDTLLTTDPNAFEMWDNSWMMVGPCTVTDGTTILPEFPPALEGDDSGGLPSPSTAPVLLTTTLSPTLASTVMVSTQISTVTTMLPTMAATPEVIVDTLPTCPPAYDMTKTTYVEGEMVTLNDHIFECMTLHVTYCNIAEWDDSLLTTDPNAFEMWDNAWVLVGPCTVTETIEADDSGGLLSAPSIAPVIVSPSTTPSKATVLLTTTNSPTMAPSVMVSTQISVDAVAVEVDDNIDDNDDNIDDNDDNLVGGSDDDSITDLAESPAPVLLTTTKSPTMAPSVMVSTQISVDAVAVEVDDNIDDNDDNIHDNDDNIDDNDDNLVDGSDDDSITDLAESPAPVLPTITTQSPTTMAPSVMVSTQSSEDTPPTTLSPMMIVPGDDDDALTPSPTLAASLLPPCPADYDITKTTYVGGDLVKLSGNVFECQVDLVKYCNIGLWDESLLTEDANAEEAWNNAWLFYSECAV